MAPNFKWLIILQIITYCLRDDKNVRFHLRFYSCRHGRVNAIVNVLNVKFIRTSAWKVEFSRKLMCTVRPWIVFRQTNARSVLRSLTKTHVKPHNYCEYFLFVTLYIRFCCLVQVRMWCSSLLSFQMLFTSLYTNIIKSHTGSLPFQYLIKSFQPEQTCLNFLVFVLINNLVFVIKVSFLPPQIY